MSSPMKVPVQRIGPLACLPHVLAPHHVPLSSVIAGLPVSEEDFRPETLLPIPVISVILERASRLTGDTEIGLRIGEGQNHLSLGPLGQLMASCETLGSALGTFAGFQMANSTAAAAWLHPVGEEYAFGFGVYIPDLASSHVYDVSAAVGFNLVRDLTQGAVTPVEVLLSRPAPADPAAYRQFFRCPVRFDEGQTCLILPRRGLSTRLASADPLQHEHLVQAMRQKLAETHPDFASRVRHALRPLLIAGAASHRQVAAHLNMHPRTFGRRLEAENVTFETLKDDVRKAVSQELLARTGLAIADVGAALGYGTPSAFVRAFRRWTGKSPSAWRQNLHVHLPAVSKWQTLAAEASVSSIEHGTEGASS